MKLAREFIRLPLQFDAVRMAEEVAALPQQAWQAHPTSYTGNSAVPLISVNGEANDFFAGPMGESPWLQQCPYLRQVLARFDVVLGRSRLMGLQGGHQVPRHSDTNYHWFQRVRIHVPVITFPEVKFHCGDQEVHMGQGEAWVFDNWRSHHVVNPTSSLRVHLVADTVGSAAFWQMVEHAVAQQDIHRPRQAINYRPDWQPELELENFNTPDVMHPAEVQLLSEDLIADLLASGDRNPDEPVHRFIACVRAFCRDWKALWALHGENRDDWKHYEQKRDELLQQLLAIRKPLKLASNDKVAQKVMLSRVLVACVNRPMSGINAMQYGN